MLALTTDSIKSLGIGAVVAVVVLGIVASLVVQKLIAKVISLAVMAVLALLVLNQRSSITDCADKVKGQAANVVTGRVTAPTCSFFGVKVTVPIDKVGG